MILATQQKFMNLLVESANHFLFSSSSDLHEDEHTESSYVLSAIVVLCSTLL